MTRKAIESEQFMATTCRKKEATAGLAACSGLAPCSVSAARPSGAWPLARALSHRTMVERPRAKRLLQACNSHDQRKQRRPLNRQCTAFAFPRRRVLQMKRPLRPGQLRGFRDACYMYFCTQSTSTKDRRMRLNGPCVERTNAF